MHTAADNIPPQTEGEHNDFIHFADCETVEEAHQLFLLAKDRLKDISQWHVFSGPHSAKFAITDTKGAEIYKMAQKGDLFSIDLPLPTPGSLAGDGKEWVRIEAMEEIIDAHAESEYLTMTIRPVANPRHPDKATAHFFSHASTNTFIVERYLNHVSAAVYGRNEMPNNSGTGLYDTVRNTIVALGARNGLSGPQWQPLVKGLLNR
ncbi:hypothetical protein [Mucilaginibacter phyllosphaerae]|uniref:Uncharacterized protein n=1 Tax=Mucilaginibacter phyllosphaerae TaxID=1812349 RepID=A0A4Y8AFZ4_9SPHI|nr:hypothetical protein [Mucilaginibacter phyllosphaerae]MBB3970415.1 hypothetical protein [Mucilaginibacter phyllosphaerae]TEW66919.1 hypothetical protein E2R65_10950 [Mucilaginibacter phyllosphaerae]GGH12783.1 hypothetical protein GCM10007352_19780 [Mucilaginibacter phyllosphaerae]